MIDVAHIINDSWDAVYEMPAATFLTLLQYRNDKADYERDLARRAAKK